MSSATLQAAFENAKKLVAETDWKHEKDSQGCSMDSKPMNGISINCYRVVDKGVVAKSPKALADKMIGFSEAEWKTFDPSIKFRKVLSSNPEVFHQQNGMPWPLSARDFVLELGRFTDTDGSEYVMVADVSHPEAPEVKGVVRARVLVGGFIFLAREGGTKCVRLVQVDPAGNIPTAIVNSKASDFINDVVKMRAL